MIQPASIEEFDTTTGPNLAIDLPHDGPYAWTLLSDPQRTRLALELTPEVKAQFRKLVAGWDPEPIPCPACGFQL